MSVAFSKNYLYELPEDILVLIYKKAFKETLITIEDMREATDNYNKLLKYITEGTDSNNNPIQNQAIWNIIARREIGEPYYKYYQYYADASDAKGTDFLHLNRLKMTRNDASFSTIKYIEFSIYPIQDKVPSANYNYIKNTYEQYIHIFLSLRHYNANTNMNNGDIDYEYKNIKDIKLLNDKIRVEFHDAYIFKNYIDVYNNILDTYNFIVCILDILSMFNNTIYPEYNLDYMNDLTDLRDWFKFNAYFGGFTLNNKGDTVYPFFSS